MVNKTALSLRPARGVRAFIVVLVYIAYAIIHEKVNTKSSQKQLMNNVIIIIDT